jgi:hypothetical protein
MRLWFADTSAYTLIHFAPFQPVSSVLVGYLQQTHP